jgi:hypothetical protein
MSDVSLKDADLDAILARATEIIFSDLLAGDFDEVLVERHTLMWGGALCIWNDTGTVTLRNGSKNTYFGQRPWRPGEQHGMDSPCKDADSFEEVEHRERLEANRLAREERRRERSQES